MYQRSWQVWLNRSCFTSRRIFYIKKWLSSAASINFFKGFALFPHMFDLIAFSPVPWSLFYCSSFFCLFVCFCLVAIIKFLFRKLFIWRAARHHLLTAVCKLWSQKPKSIRVKNIFSFACDLHYTFTWWGTKNKRRRDGPKRRNTKTQNCCLQVQAPACENEK